MMKKNRSTMIVSLRRGRADIRAVTSSLRPSIFVIVLKGLRTLNTLKLDMLIC